MSDGSKLVAKLLVRKCSVGKNIPSSNDIEPPYKQASEKSAGNLEEVASNSGDGLITDVLPVVSFPVFLMNNFRLGYIKYL